MNRTAITLRVRDVMTPAPVTVGTATQFVELIALFERHDFNAFPVVDDEHVLHGIVTKLDMLRLLRPDQDLRLPLWEDVAGLSVGALMRRGVVTTEPADPVAVAADLMVGTGLRSLPVVARVSGRPVLTGIVSRSDVLRGVREEMAREDTRAAPAPAARRARRVPAGRR